MAKQAKNRNRRGRPPVGHSPPAPAEAVDAPETAPSPVADPGAFIINSRAMGSLIDQVAADADRLRSFTCALGRSFEELVEQLSPEERQQIARECDLRVDPRYVQGGFGAAIRRQVSGNDRLAAKCFAGWYPYLHGLVVLAQGLELDDDWDAQPVDADLGWQTLIDEQSDDVLIAIWLLFESARQPGDESVQRFLDSLVEDLATEAAASDEQRPVHQLDCDEALFTPLDQLLIRTTFAVAMGAEGAPTAQDFGTVIEELFRLNADRKQTWFHPGFVQALLDLDLPLPEAADNEARRVWRTFGRISGFARRADAELLAAEVLQEWPRAAKILADGRMGTGLVAPAVRALLAGNRPDRALEVLAAAPPEVADGGELFEHVYQRARALLPSGQHGRAADLFDALRTIAPHAVGLRMEHPEPYASVDDVLADLARRRSACKRAANKFGAAQGELDGAPTPTSAWCRSLLESERGLVQARVSHLSNLQFPRSDDERDSLVEGLRRGEGAFASALEIHPEEMRAAYSLGLLAWCTEDFDATVDLLERALRSIEADPAGDVAEIVPGMELHRAVALLLGSDLSVTGPAFASLRAALKEGARPPAGVLVSAADALLSRGALHTARFVLEAADAVGTLAPFADVIVEAAEADGGVDLALRAVEDPTLPPSIRVAAAVAGARAAHQVGDGDSVARLVELADDVVADAFDPAVDRAWADALRVEEALRLEIGPEHAEVARLSSLRRAGDDLEARSVAERLFHRAAQDELDGVDPRDLLVTLRGLGAPEAEIDALARRLPCEPELPLRATDDDRPVSIVMVGGNEVQEAYDRSIEQHLLEVHRGKVTVHWVHSGWSANWPRFADKAESLYAECDAVVLSYFVRTNLGRRIRRTAGEADLPWIACAGHGRDAITRAIERAVVVARSRQAPPSAAGAA